MLWRWQRGIPPDVIVWDPLRDYEEIIRMAKLPLKVESIERYENSNPFLLACSMLLINQKNSTAPSLTK